MINKVFTSINYMTLDYFFSDPNDVPEDALWHAYGWQHFLWLIAMGLIMFFSCRAFRKLDSEKQSKVLKRFAIFILIQEIVKDLLFWYS